MFLLRWIPAVRLANLIGLMALIHPLSATERPGQIALADLDLDPHPSPYARALVQRALALSALGLRYTYGSADPGQGGMDCSGTIQHLLLSAGWKDVPRQANTIYAWVWQTGRFHAVNSFRLDSFEFTHLRPGDLLFWSGTYEIQREPPVTHVMLYLGRRTHDQRPLMFGASEGRPFEGRARRGVGVFDFVLPRPGSPGRFLGYGSIPPPPQPVLTPAATDASSPAPPDAVEPEARSNESASPAAVP